MSAAQHPAHSQVSFFDVPPSPRAAPPAPVAPPAEQEQYLYTTNDDGTVDYADAFRNDVYAAMSALELIEDVLFPVEPPHPPRPAPVVALPRSWLNMLHTAWSLLDFTEEPLSQGDVCVHHHCQRLIHHLALYTGECAAAIDRIDRSDRTARRAAVDTVEAFGNALLTVFAFAQHYLSPEQCTDRGIPAMVHTLQHHLAHRTAAFPADLAAALNQHTQHIWLHTFGTPSIAPIQRDAEDEEEEDRDGEEDEEENEEDEEDPEEEYPEEEEEESDAEMSTE